MTRDILRLAKGLIDNAQMVWDFNYKQATRPHNLAGLHKDNGRLVDVFQHMVEPDNIKVTVRIPGFQQVTTYHCKSFLSCCLSRLRIWFTSIAIKSPPTHGSKEIPSATSHIQNPTDPVEVLKMSVAKDSLPLELPWPKEISNSKCLDRVTFISNSQSPTQ
jgi:hypothetical protein